MRGGGGDGMGARGERGVGLCGGGDHEGEMGASSGGKGAHEGATWGFEMLKAR